MTQDNILSLELLEWLSSNQHFTKSQKSTEINKTEFKIAGILETWGLESLKDQRLFLWFLQNSYFKIYNVMIWDHLRNLRLGCLSSMISFSLRPESRIRNRVVEFWRDLL